MLKFKTIVLNVKPVNFLERSHFLPLALLFLLPGLASCPAEHECDTAGYAPPEIRLIEPEDPDILARSDTVFAMILSLRAEAGLNTLSMNGEPIHVFTRGEKELDFEFSYYFWENGEYNLILHDLCDRSADLLLRVTVEHPFY